MSHGVRRAGHQPSPARMSWGSFVAECTPPLSHGHPPGDRGPRSALSRLKALLQAEVPGEALGDQHQRLRPGAHPVGPRQEIRLRQRRHCRRQHGNVAHDRTRALPADSRSRAVATAARGSTPRTAGCCARQAAAAPCRSPTPQTQTGVGFVRQRAPPSVPARLLRNSALSQAPAVGMSATGNVAARWLNGFTATGSRAHAARNVVTVPSMTSNDRKSGDKLFRPHGLDLRPGAAPGPERVRLPDRMIAVAGAVSGMADWVT